MAEFRFLQSSEILIQGKEIIIFRNPGKYNIYILAIMETMCAIVFLFRSRTEFLGLMKSIYSVINQF